jgi:hypothetical protein
MIKTKIISENSFQKKIVVNVDEELFLLIRRIELNYGLSWKEARNSVSIAIKKLYSIENKNL